MKEIIFLSIFYFERTSLSIIINFNFLLTVSKTPNVLELVFVDNWWVGGTFMLVMVLTLILLICLLVSCLCDFPCMRRRSEVHMDGGVARNGSVHYSA